MDHAVYVVVSDPDEVEAVTEAASELAPGELASRLCPLGRQRPKPETELAFRIGGGNSPEEALNRAQRIYARSPEAAGLGPDEEARLSVGRWPGSVASFACRRSSA